MSNRSIGLSDELQQYLLDHSLREHPVAHELRVRTATMENARMQISPEQGQFIAWLLGTLNAQRTLEIGVFTGYSTLVTALALPPHGRVVACDISAEFTDIARPFWERAGVAERIQLELRPALDTLEQLTDAGETETFDFAFIDADKENYRAYYEQTLKLLRPGGVIAVDNVLWSGRVLDPADQDSSTVALREFNRAVRQDARVAISMLPIGDGLTLLRKLAG